jgi:hypothetical protein
MAHSAEPTHSVHCRAAAAAAQRRRLLLCRPSKQSMKLTFCRFCQAASVEGTVCGMRQQLCRVLQLLLRCAAQFRGACPGRP